MNPYKVGVIIPVYNVKDYLEVSVRSIVNQTYDYLDIILVDDGSTDGSSEICDKLAEEDTRIHVFHNDNMGLSGARNFGVRQTQADWIVFCDSDDYYHHRAIEVLVDIQRKSQADLVISGKKSVSPKDKEEQHIYSSLTEDFIIQKSLDVYKQALYEQITVSAGAKLIQRYQLLTVLFPENVIYEDLYLFPRLIQQNKHIAISKDTIYYYVQSSDSITRSGFKDNQLDFFKAINENKQVITTYYTGKAQEELLHALMCREYVYGISIYDKLYLSGDTERVAQFRKSLNKHITSILCDRHLKLQKKIKVALFGLSPGMYSFVYHYIFKRLDK